MLSTAHRQRRRQRGLSPWVELMVGITIGMIVVAGASLLVATQLGDNRRLLLEVQVQQDLRATADIVTRELRRAGSWGAAVDGSQAGVAVDTASPSANPLLDVTPSADGAMADSVTYSSSRAAGSTGPYGFRLSDGVVQSQLEASSGWQALTDAATMTVTRFEITAQNEAPVRIPCPKRCVDGSTDCWPTVTVRSFVIDLTGRSTSDPAVVRSVRSAVRLRNDRVQFNDAVDPTLACPA